MSRVQKVTLAIEKLAEFYECHNPIGVKSGSCCGSIIIRSPEIASKGQ